MKRINLLPTLTIAVMLMAGSGLAGTYTGGSGTAGDPYQIATTGDLIKLSNTSADWDKYFIQTADITFDADETQVDWDGDGTADWDADDQLGFFPIGTNDTEFTGEYDGQNFEIINLFMNRPDNTHTFFFGLFGRADNVVISNLGLVDCDITAADNAGALAGRSENGSDISNCYSSGSINAGGNGKIGGLVGRNNGSAISNSYSSCDVSGGSYIGGLVGDNDDNGTITGSYSTGSVDAEDNAGGLVGRNMGNGSTINSSYSSASAQSSSNIVGGLAGTNQGTISKSYSIGNVEGVEYVGGLVGVNVPGTISKSYSTGNVKGDNNVGGLVGAHGVNGGAVSNSYSTGNVEGTGSAIGGLVGANVNDYPLNNSFWDTQTSGISVGVGSGDASGVTGKTTTEMTTQSTFSAWTFDASNWAMSDGNFRPLLAWQDVAVDNSAPSTVGSGQVEFPAANIHNNTGGSITVSYGYIYNQGTPPTWDNNTKMEVATGVSVASGANQAISSTTVSSLTPETDYYALAYATDGSDVWYGETVRFTTAVPLPEVNLTSPQNNTGAADLTHEFTWNASGTGTLNCTLYVDTVLDVFGNGDVFSGATFSASSHTLSSDLTARKTYYWGIAVTDDKGTTQSVVR
ncbi:MAG: hypothetical protein GF344_20250, partial [Chitinivibrionales bacterium]|nr:hypothetical protein [Chitinivibrionales bacterium]